MSAGFRRRPLHTCAESFIAIARKTSCKAQDHNGPLGTLAKKSAVLGTLASPLFSATIYLILATLILVDDYILACQDKLVSVYPPSVRAFDKINELVQAVEALPCKFDAFCDQIPKRVPRVPFIERALINVFARLSFLFYGLVGWISRKIGKKGTPVDETYMKGKEDLGARSKEESSYKKKKEDNVVNPKGELVGQVSGEKESSYKVKKEEGVAKAVDELVGRVSRGTEENKTPLSENYMKGKEDLGVNDPSYKENNEENVKKAPNESFGRVSGETEEKGTQSKEDLGARLAKEPSYKEKEKEDVTKVVSDMTINSQEKEDIIKESSYNEENDAIANESSAYETDATKGSINEEIIANLNDDQPNNASDVTLEKENDPRKGEDGAGSDAKPSAAEKWIEAGWAVKPKQAPKRKQKGKKKKN